MFSSGLQKVKNEIGGEKNEYVQLQQQTLLNKFTASDYQYADIFRFFDECKRRDENKDPGDDWENGWDVVTQGANESTAFRLSHRGWGYFLHVFSNRFHVDRFFQVVSF